MAIGTITKAAPTVKNAVGNRAMRVFDVQLTSGANYTTGGEVITPAMVGFMHRIEHVSNTGQARTTAGGAASIPLSIDFATLVASGSIKLQQYVAASGAEQSAAANLSTFSVRLAFFGV